MRLHAAHDQRSSRARAGTPPFIDIAQLMASAAPCPVGLVYVAMWAPRRYFTVVDIDPGS